MDFKLSLKRSLNYWTKEFGGVKFKLKYPTIEQGKKLEVLERECYEYEVTQDATDPEKTLIKVKDVHTDKVVEKRRYEIKIWIEDWEGMTEDGNPVKCELVNNELEASLHWALVRDIRVMNELHNFLKEEIEFADIDKKK